VRKKPAWWDWEVELSDHLLDRMGDRQFSELDLRAMMDRATSVRRDYEPGRWVVLTHMTRRRWEIIVEPDAESRTLFVVTAYPVSR
jgi:hypothetical protein